MKCIQFYNPDLRIVRVSDEEADKAVRSGKAHYVSRAVWKTKVREPLANEAYRQRQIDEKRAELLANIQRGVK